MDRDKALTYLDKAADAGYGKALYRRGYLYRTGREGKTQSDSRARRDYERGKEVGNLNAINGLGVIYDNGEGVPEDNDKAFELYKEAALKGHPSAQYNLGKMYEQGSGTRVDVPEAIKWYKEAREKNVKGAIEALERLGE